VRWPRLRRRKAHEGVPSDIPTTYQPGSWGQRSLPPFEGQLADAPTGNVEVVAPPPQSPPPIAAAVGLTERPVPPVLNPPGPVGLPPVPIPDGGSTPVDDDTAATGVRLGFADGSDLQLDPDHPHSLALRAVADVLLHRGTHRRRAG
jgi:hypothetical protein